MGLGRLISGWMGTVLVGALLGFVISAAIGVFVQDSGLFGASGESPFFILESMDHELSFPVIHPDLVALDYRVPVSPEILASLDATTAADLVLFLIVTVRERVEDITINLQGPLIVNSASLIGIQFVIEEYPVRYALIRADSAK